MDFEKFYEMALPWLEKEELSHLAITGKDGKPSRTLNPLKEETLEFMDKIYDGYIPAVAYVLKAAVILISLKPRERNLNFAHRGINCKWGS